MIRVHGAMWRIENEDDLFENSDAAKHLIEYAEKEGENDGLRWFFQEGYIDYAEQTVTAIFKSYSTPEYKNHLLSLTARKNKAGECECKIQKKIVASSEGDAT